MNAFVSPHLIAKFTDAKEDFKANVCRQVDALFNTFLEQIQPSGLQLVTMTGQPHGQQGQHQSQGTTTHQTFTVGGQQILLTSSASADPQTLADIIAGGADSDLLHHLMPVGGACASSANTPQTITINHFGAGNNTTQWETIQTADGNQILATSSANAEHQQQPQQQQLQHQLQSQQQHHHQQQPQKQTGSKRKAGNNLPTATKTATTTVATKSRPPPATTNFLTPGQAGGSGTISLVPIVVSTSTNAHHHQMQTTMQTLPGTVTYQLPLNLPGAPPASTNSEIDVQSSTGDAVHQEVAPWADLDSDCDCSECEGSQQSSSAQGESTSTNGDKTASRPKKIKTDSSGSTSTRIFPCPVTSCSLVFHRRHQLRDHRLTSHSGISTENSAAKSFACRHRDCGKVFQSPNHLRRHECIHTNQRPYKCTWEGCTFVAIQRSDAIRHVRVKHYNLPRTFKLQQEMNIEDTRDPLEFIEVTR